MFSFSFLFLLIHFLHIHTSPRRESSFTLSFSTLWFTFCETYLLLDLVHAHPGGDLFAFLHSYIGFFVFPISKFDLIISSPRRLTRLPFRCLQRFSFIHILPYLCLSLINCLRLYSCLMREKSMAHRCYRIRYTTFDSTNTKKEYFWGTWFLG